jgi:hypothetical protein
MDNPYAQTPDDAPASKPDLPPIPDDAPKAHLPPHKRNIFKGRFGVLGGLITIIAVVALIAYTSGIIPPVSEWYQPDHSQTLEQAYAAGAPRIDKTWTLDDYRAFQTYVESVDPDAYPRYDSTKSQALFRKVVRSVSEARENALPTWDPENIENASWELDDMTQRGSQSQTEASLKMMSIIAQCAMPYLQANNAREADYSLEMAHLMGAGMVAARGVATDPFFANMSADPRMANQFETMSSAITAHLEAVLADMTQTGFSDDERAVIARAILENGPALFEFLSPADQKRIIARTQEAIKKIDGKRTRPIMRQFAVKIERSHASTTAE